MTPDTMFKVYAKRGYKIISWEEVEIRSYIENTIFWCYAACRFVNHIGHYY